jgi:hypothetical protein
MSTTIKKAAVRLTHVMLFRILELFVLQIKIRKMLAGIDSMGMSHGGILSPYKMHQITK